ncbi:MAG: hypothetical protein PWQ51_900 [Methanolobus sp.]|jgi:hypothetical protein|uniref:PEF-CTERM sorting domain-containing protein n=1 Tax=Methanolobus sp. TaxID=1874737 RepID=UPI0024AAB7EA|nr:PEF-CTERM sorting domain-containing protein [Methanolobus sp.]MDI3485893.1 hypothetical protein [Methanolobus sp.]MDK2832432.1 hypothetical protein [Methanolobus sp.]MDK2938736.1 hypothetical protein [Methanolobus sp.]
MRKLSILICAALLLTMAQTASAMVVAPTEFADGCYCVKLEGSYGVPAPASVQLAPTGYEIQVDAQVCKNGEDIDVTILSSNPGVTIDELEFISLYQEFIEISANGTCAMGHTFNGTMHLTGDGQNYASTYATGTLDGQIPLVGDFTITINECENSIPEFPTIALPVAAIIGLAFFMQRRKD